VETALAIRDKIKELPDFKGIDGYKPMVSIGIKSGEMVSGNIGSSSLRRLDYTVIGDTVNVAARLQGAAGENQIVISQDCYGLLRESFKCRELGEVTLKNKANPITIYEVLE
jgi:class 3 adenylate cyclase